jgi:hypothetical protein
VYLSVSYIFFQLKAITSVKKSNSLVFVVGMNLWWMKWHCNRFFYKYFGFINVIKKTCRGYKCQVVHDGKLTQPIQINSGVKQGCILSPTVFQLVSDSVVRNVLKGRKRGIRWGLNSRLEDLDLADDICLLSARFRDMEIEMTKLQEEANNDGRNINAEKTKGTPT